jgi:hypothetical protein
MARVSGGAAHSWQALMIFARIRFSSLLGGVLLKLKGKK